MLRHRYKVYWVAVDPGCGIMLEILTQSALVHAEIVGNITATSFTSKAATYAGLIDAAPGESL